MKRIVTVLLLVACIALSFAAFAGCDKPVEIKNVILIIGDGMGFNHIANAQKYFDDTVFDYEQNLVGSATTYSKNNEVTDSAAAATALATGNKVNNGNVARFDGENLTSITAIARQNGKRTGIITSDYLYGATPAGFSAHADSRKDYETIAASQALSGVDLLVGDRDKGGYYRLYEEDFAANDYVITDSFDQLLATPKTQKVVATLKGLRSKYNENITNNTVDYEKLLNYAFDYLDNDNGFFLMIENAYVDKCSHDNEIYDAVCEVRLLSDVINQTVKRFENRKDTVIIVTADHETGGLTLAEDKSQITDELYTRTSHSNANVPLYVFGYDMGEQKVYDNTDIFKLCETLVTKRDVE